MSLTLTTQEVELALTDLVRRARQEDVPHGFVAALEFTQHGESPDGGHLHCEGPEVHLTELLSMGGALDVLCDGFSHLPAGFEPRLLTVVHAVGDRWVAVGLPVPQSPDRPAQIALWHPNTRGGKVVIGPSTSSAKVRAVVEDASAALSRTAGRLQESGQLVGAEAASR